MTVQKFVSYLLTMILLVFVLVIPGQATSPAVPVALAGFHLPPVVMQMLKSPTAMVAVRTQTLGGIVNVACDPDDYPDPLPKLHCSGYFSNNGWFATAETAAQQDWFDASQYRVFATATAEAYCDNNTTVLEISVADNPRIVAYAGVFPPGGPDPLAWGLMTVDVHTTATEEETHGKAEQEVLDFHGCTSVFGLSNKWLVSLL